MPAPDRASAPARERAPRNRLTSHARRRQPSSACGARPPCARQRQKVSSPTGSSSTTPTRRLSAVLLADVSGYSRMMGEDEPETVAAVGTLQVLFARLVPEHGGTLEVFVGDCFVALFASAVDALHAALAIQEELSSGTAGTTLRVRIGLHLGDVLRTDAGLFGDPINVAARLQTLTVPGGICLSGDVHRAVRGKVKVSFHDLGQHALKNITTPVHVYEIRIGAAAGARPPARRAQAGRRRWLAAAAGLLLLAGAGTLHRLAGRGLSPHGGTGDGPLVVGVMDLRPRGPTPAWMCELTRDAFNTVFSKVARLRVYSKEKIDFLREKRGLSEIEAAETLGITK